MGDDRLKDRNAVSTLKGYFYQFDFSILQLLNLENMADKVTIEGIEDIDITTVDSKQQYNVNIMKVRNIIIQK